MTDCANDRYNNSCYYFDSDFVFFFAFRLSRRSFFISFLSFRLDNTRVFVSSLSLSLSAISSGALFAVAVAAVTRLVVAVAVARVALFSQLNWKM